MMKYLKPVKYAVVPLALLFSSSVFADSSPHHDRISCYASVHGGCFDGKPHCSTEVYNEFLDMCDTGYPAGKGKRKPYGFAAPSQTVVKSLTYKTKMQKLRRHIKRK